MAQDDQATRPMNFQVPDEMRRMAEQSVTQARQALENYLQTARRTSESMEQTSDKVQASTKDAAQKTLSAVEQNLRASLDYAQRLVRAKDLQEITQIQSEFARTPRLFNALSERDVADSAVRDVFSLSEGKPV